MLALPLPAAAAGPQAVAEAFCAASGDEAAAEVLMTPSLRQQIAALRTADAAFRAAHPQDKPPLGDGLPLAAFPDPAGPCMPQAATATEAILAYPPPAGWQDRLVLAPDGNGGVLIDDIRFGDGPDDTLRRWLTESAAWK